ncbi:sensor histidine kinase [Pedobacter lusitanus]|uniref:sensor histidine kinase n=1 Tax=Pedobacter lusitanus TaxID=1503925 RepID=UPI00190F652C|nr:histidine kinase [Pedobacter lusitanus]
MLSLYWKCQIIGWSVASLYWGYAGFLSGNFDFLIGSLQFITDVAIYIGLTNIYHKLALKNNWRNLGFNQILKLMIPAVFVMGVAYTIVTLLKTYLFRYWFFPVPSQSLLLFFKSGGLNIFIAGIRLMSIWLLAYHLYQYAQREIAITKENARLVMINKDTQLHNLSAQLNPHFLFNSLNTIKALVLENPKDARRAIDLLSDLLRSGLYNKDNMQTIVSDEINLVKDYLELEKLRMEGRLQQDIAIDPLLMSFIIPRLSIQTLVENAIKHGVARQKDGGFVYIEIKKDNDQISISVKNTGQFNGKESSHGIGLKNLSERLRLQYGGLAKFTITEQPKGVVLASLLIPIL